MTPDPVAVAATAQVKTAPDPTYPPRMRSDKAASYLRDVHGLPVEDKTMRNWRAAGRGPTCRYLGIVPLYDRTELDRWADREALKEECPMRRNRRMAVAAVEDTSPSIFEAALAIAAAPGGELLPDRAPESAGSAASH